MFVYVSVVFFFLYREVRLSPVAVKNDVELLKCFCSKGEKRVLKSVQYTSGLNYLHISLGLKKAITISGNAGYSKNIKYLCSAPKTWKSLYMSDFSLLRH